MLSLDNLSQPILKKSNTLIKVRIWVMAVAYAHLVIIAYWLLSIDFSQAEDLNLRCYQEKRWKLITTWFNLLTLVYHPTCIYCDWKELKGEGHLKHVKILNKARHLLFTSILLPTTSFGDILFWRVWNKDRELIAPESVDAIVPFWTQHCMHTVSLIVILLDLVLMPRERPKNMLPGVTLLTFFLSCYVFVCARSFLNGEYIYPGLKIFSGTELILLIVYIYVENFFYYTSQWLIIDMVWGTGKVKKSCMDQSINFKCNKYL